MRTRHARRLRGLAAASLALLFPAAAWSAAEPAAAPVKQEAPAAATRPAARPAPFLWRIAGAKPSWLFGTIHLPEERVLALPRVVETAIDGCDALFTEIPMDPEAQVAMTTDLFLDGGKTLTEILPADLYERLDQRFAKRSLPLAALARLKVWAIAVQVPLLDHILSYAGKQPLDAALYLRAQGAEKEVGGIETVAEQLAVFDGLTEAEQVQMLRSTLDLLDEMERDGRDMVAELLEAYLGGDAGVLWTLMSQTFDPENPLDKKMMQRVFHERNVLMADRIAAKVKAAPERSLFFAVGAGHLAGPDSMIELLQKRGVTLERVAAGSE